MTARPVPLEPDPELMSPVQARSPLPFGLLAWIRRRQPRTIELVAPEATGGRDRVDGFLAGSGPFRGTVVVVDLTDTYRVSTSWVDELVKQVLQDGLARRLELRLPPSGHGAYLVRTWAERAATRRHVAQGLHIRT